MAQPTDIVLNSAGYMIQPGTPQNPGYKRLQDGHPEGRTQRTSITDFFGGQRRALQLERDQFGDSLAIGPALGGQGVAPWGKFQSNPTASMVEFPDKERRIPQVNVRNTSYFAIGPRLYRRPETHRNGLWGPILVHTYDNPITDMTIYSSFGILIAFGSAADIAFWNTTTNTTTAFASGERANHIENYNGFAIWSDARTASIPTVIRMARGSGFGVEFRNVSHDIIGLVTVGAHLILVTRQSLFRFSGRVKDVMVPNPDYTGGGTQPPQIPGQEWSGEFDPFFQQGHYSSQDDFTFLESYGGRILAWIAGGIHELIPSGDRAGWRSTGLQGAKCFGGTISNGYAIVSIQSEDNINELWAYDGNGWWRLMQQPMAATGTWCWPMNLAKTGLNQWNLAVFSEGTNALWSGRIVNSTVQETDMAFSATAQFVTPMIDAGERDKTKAWRKIGAVFASPEKFGNLDSTDNVWFDLDYSIDGGDTWVNAALDQKIGNTLANMNFAMEAALSGVVSRFIMLRVKWISVDGWTPILTGVWAEHEILDTPARRRKWQLKIHARDQEIDRDGVLLTRTGRQLIAELWSAWETDTPLPFRDIDYDDAPVQRTVRIVGISELTNTPSDSNRWGDSTITLNLVEV